MKNSTKPTTNYQFTKHNNYQCHPSEKSIIKVPESICVCVCEMCLLCSLGNMIGRNDLQTSQAENSACPRSATNPRPSKC